MSDFSARVFEAVSKISRGETMTYGEGSGSCGSPGACPAVENVLNKNRDFEKVPCHRVIMSDGSVGEYAIDPALKLKRPKEEGAI